jgi:hypothetical protein
MRLARLLFCVVVVLCLTGTASAQVVREDGVKSIAGVVGGTVGFVEWKFRSQGGEVLFASLDAFIYEQRQQGPHEMTMAEGGGCTGGTGTGGETGGGCGGETGGGCSEESGPSRLCLQVLNSADQVVCYATRPMPPPGWQRDPRMACLLPPPVAVVSQAEAEEEEAGAEYRVRVVQVSMGMGGEGEGEEGQEPILCDQYHQTGRLGGDPYPFLLNVSLRRLPPSGVNIQAAIAQSNNRF